MSDQKDVSVNKGNQGSMLASHSDQSTMACKENFPQMSSWCPDSGSKSHMCNDKSLFTEFHLQENFKIQLAVVKSDKATGIGEVLIIVPFDTGKTYFTLNNILCVLELKCNLISTSKATTNHCSVIFKEWYAKIMELNGSTRDANIKKILTGVN